MLVHSVQSRHETTLRYLSPVQLAQIAAALLVQSVPVAGLPFEQVHSFVAQAVPSRWNPSLQLSQIAASSLVQAVPVAGLPFEQVHVFSAGGSPDSLVSVMLHVHDGCESQVS